MKRNEFHNTVNETDVKLGWDALLLLRDETRQKIKAGQSENDREILGYHGRRCTVMGKGNGQALIKFPDGNGFWVELEDIQAG